MAIKTIRVFQEFTSAGYVPMPVAGNIDYGVTIANTFPATTPATFQTDDPDIDVTLTATTDYYVWIRSHGTDWNPMYTRNVRVYPDSPLINNVVMGIIIANLDGTVPYVGATTNVDLGEFGLKAGYLGLDLTPTATPTTVGTMSWNDADGTVDLKLKGGNVTLQVGQEQVTRIVNKTGANLLEANYQAVRVSGAQGNRLKVDLAQANLDANSAETLGLVTETINNNQEGFITTSGLVRNIDTTGTLQGETWADGDILYLSGTTAGRITNVKPQAPTHTVIMGYVVRAHQTQGQIYVKVDNGYELDELHNVKIIGALNKDVLVYNSTTKLWENRIIFKTQGYVPFYDDTLLLNNSPLYTNGNNVAIGSLTLTEKLVVGGNVLANQFKKVGGLSTEFLKADGSSDATAYQPLSADLTAIDNLALTTGLLRKNGLNTWELDQTEYLSVAIAGSTYQTLANLSSNLTASTTKYPSVNAVNTGLALKLNLTGGTLTGGLTLNYSYPNIALSDVSSGTTWNIQNDGSTFKLNYGATNNFYIFSSGNAAFINNLTANALIKSGGTSTQFLKADGSVDSTNYQPYDADLASIAGLELTTGLLRKNGLNTYTLDQTEYVALSTANSTYQTLANLQSNLNASSTKYPSVNAVNTGLNLKLNLAGGTLTGDLALAYSYPNIQLSDTSSGTIWNIQNDGGGFEINSGITNKFVMYSSGNATFVNDLTANKFIKSGGTSSQFLMADGSVSSGNAGTVTSVGLSAPTGFSVSGSPVTTSGTLALAFSAGYSLPSDAIQATWTAKQNALNGTGFVKISGTTISYDNSTYYLASNPSGFISGITSGMVTTALGYTPVTNARQLTINGTTYDLSADRSWTISGTIGGLTSGFIPKATSASTLGNSLIYDNGTNIGIGTISPSVKLQVENNSHNYIFLNSSVANVQTSFSVQNTSSGKRTSLSWEDGTRGDFADLYTSTYLTFTTGTSEKMRLTSGGNLLVGTTTDAGYKLDINGTGRFSGNLDITSAGSTTITNNGINPILDFIRTNSATTPTAQINFKTSQGTVRWQIAINRAIGGFEINEGDASNNRFYISSGGAATFSSSVTAIKTTIGDNGFGSQWALMYHADSTGASNPFIGIDNSSGSIFYNVKTNGSHVWRVNNSTQMTLTTAGNLGLGTTSPATKFHAYGSSQGIARFESSQGEVNIALNNSSASGNLIGTVGANFYFYSGGAERMRLDSSGNLGLGVTPSAGGLSGYALFEIANGGASIYGGPNQNLNGANISWSGGTASYKISNFATLYNQQSGQHQWYTAPSGTAGNAISFTQAMTLLANGSLSIGKTNSTYGTSTRTSLELNGSTDSILALYSGGSLGGYLFANGTVNTEWYSTGFTRISNNGSERMRITTLGEVLINTTSSAFSNTNRGTLEINGASTSILGLTINGSAAGYLYHGGTNLSVWNVLNGSMEFGTNNTTRLTITSGGNVGIGTTNPLLNLQINSSSGNNSTLAYSVNNVLTWYARHNAGDGAYQIVDVTNTTTRLAILPSGNVGIGTTSPLALLNVVASGTKSTIAIGNTAASTYSQVLMYGGSGKYNWSLGAQYNVNNGFEITPSTAVDGTTFTTPVFQITNSGAATFSSSVTAGNKITSGPGAYRAGGFYVPYSTASTASRTWAMTNDESVFGDFAIVQSSTQTGVVDTYRFYISPSGNVGIGTTSPTSMLTLNGTTPFIRIERSGVNTWQIQNNYLVNQNGFSINNISAGTIPFFIGENGNIGVGTASPSYALDVYNTGASLARVRVVGTTNFSLLQAQNDSGVLYMGIDSSTGGGFGIGNYTRLIWSSGAYPLVFAVNDAERMRITSDGNIGIGTTSPVSITNYKTLQIQGTTGALLEMWAGGVRQLQIEASTGATNFYGPNNTYMAFYTNSTHRMRISEAGNVLIGTSTDSGYKLDVNGTSRFINSANFAAGVYNYVGTNRFFASASGSINYLYTVATNLTILNQGDSATLFTLTNAGVATFASSVTASSFFESSDRTIKTLITDNYSVNGIESITAKLYTKHGKEELGYFAQDVQGILPSAVTKGTNGLLNLSYREVLVAKVQSLEQRVKELETQLNLG